MEVIIYMAIASMYMSSSRSSPFIAGEETNSPRWRKHDESYFNITKNRKFVGFLDKPISSF